MYYQRLLVLFVWLLFGCQANSTVVSEVESTQLTLSGSGGGTTILQAIVEPFQAQQEQVQLAFLSGSGGSDSVQGVADGRLSIGILLSSDITKDSLDGVEILPLAYDPIAFVTHPSVGVSNLTTAQVKAIYTGEIKNWREVGGPDADIVVLTRNPDEASAFLFQEGILGEASVLSTAVMFNKAGDMRQGVTEIPYSIGFMSYGDYVIRELQADVIALDGVLPRDYTEQTYPIRARVLAVAYQADHHETQVLIDYLNHPDTDAVMQRYGVIPFD